MTPYPNRIVLAGVALCAALLGGCVADGDDGTGPDMAAGRAVLSTDRLSPSFEANVGQTVAEAQYVLRGRGHVLILTADGMRMALRRPAATGRPDPAAAPATRFEPPQEDTALLALRWLGAAKEPKVAGRRAVDTRISYYRGATPDDWITGVPVYRDVRYANLYPGIDLVFTVEAGAVRYAFHVGPDADPSRIRFALDGAEDLRVDRRGDLVIDTAAGEVRHAGLRAYQEVDGRTVPVRAHFALSRGTVGFRVADWDRARPLVIDPAVVFSGFVEAADSYWLVYPPRVAVGANGSVFMAGTTPAYEFIDSDAYVAKFDLSDPADPGAGTPVTLAYLDGTAIDSAADIAIGGGGRIYLTGSTTSTAAGGFPLLNAPQSENAGGLDAFVAAFDDTLALTFSSFFGSPEHDTGLGIAVDPEDAVFVVGNTRSPTLPGGTSVAAWGGQFDAYVVKFGPDLLDIRFVTHLGGADDDYGEAIAVDKTGVFVAGTTSSIDFPTLFPVQACPEQAPPLATGACPDAPAMLDAFLTKLDPATGEILTSTYLGGGHADYGNDVAVDGDGHAYLVGTTWIGVLVPFPTSEDVYQPASAVAGYAAFVAKVETTETDAGVRFATLLQGDAAHFGAYAIAVDSAERPWIVGTGEAPIAFGAAPPFTDVYPGGSGDMDGFVARLNDIGSALDLWAPIGGSDSDRVTDVALFGDSLYLVGLTGSEADFYTTPASGPFVGYSWDSFLVKIDFDVEPPGYTLSVEKSHIPSPVEVGGTVSFDIVVTNEGPLTAENVFLLDIAQPEKTFDLRNPVASQGSCETHSRNVVVCGLGDLVPGQSVAVGFTAVDIEPVHASVEPRNTVYVWGAGWLSQAASFVDPVTVTAP